MSFQLGILLVLCVAIPLFEIWNCRDWDQKFWDLQTYVDAAASFARGDNPYLEGNGEPRFVYPPMVLRCWSLFPDQLRSLLITSYLLSILFFCLLPGRGLVLSTLLVKALFLESQNPIAQSLEAANLTFFMHLFLLGAWLSPERSWRRLPFLPTVILASTIKPYFAAYLFLDLLAGRRTFRQEAGRIGASTALIALVWGSQFYLDRSLFLDSLRSLKLQVFGQVIRASQGDLGLGYYRLWAVLTQSLPLSLLLHGLTVILSVWLWKTRLEPRYRSFLPADHPAFTHWPILLCVMANPRSHIYDHAILEILVVHLLLCAEPRQLGRWIVIHPLVPLAGLQFLVRNLGSVLPDSHDIVMWFSIAASVYLPVVFVVAWYHLQSPRSPLRHPQSPVD